jgi:hypothetical protein
MQRIETGHKLLGVTSSMNSSAVESAELCALCRFTVGLPDKSHFAIIDSTRENAQFALEEAIESRKQK